MVTAEALIKIKDLKKDKEKLVKKINDIVFKLPSKNLVAVEQLINEITFIQGKIDELKVKVQKMNVDVNLFFNF